MRWVLLFFVVLVVIPFTISSFEECDAYLDCPKKDCVGYTRECFAGECKYSDCMIDIGLEGREGVKSFQSTLDEYKVDTSNTFGLKPILIFAGKIVLVAFILFIAALLMSAFGIKGFLKIFFFMIILVVILGSVFFFSGSSLLNLLGLSSFETSAEVSALALYAQEREYVLQDRDVLYVVQGVYSSSVNYAKEFSLTGKDDELNLVVVSFDRLDESDAFSIGRDLFREKNVSGTKVFYKEDSFSSSNMFILNDKIFYLTGEKFKAKKLLNMLIDNSEVMESVPDSNKKGSPRSIGPVVEILVPKNDSMMNQPMFSFRVYEGDDDVGFDKIDVLGVGGFYNALDDCVFSSGTFDCNFYGEDVNQGWNSFSVEVVDLNGVGSRSAVNFFYDSYPPEILNIPAGIYNTLDLNIDMIDSGVGINIDSIKLNGLKAELECEGRIDGYSCIFYTKEKYDDGKYNFTLMVKDRVGNQLIEKISVVLDSKKPDISNIGNSVIIEDENGINENSIFVDNRRYDAAKCEKEGKKYICNINNFRTIKVFDSAGNYNEYEFVNIRS